MCQAAVGGVVTLVALGRVAGGEVAQIRPGVELPVDDVALPEIEFDQRANVEQSEINRCAKKVCVVREIPHDAVDVAEHYIPKVRQLPTGIVQGQIILIPLVVWPGLINTGWPAQCCCAATLADSLHCCRL